MTRREGQRIASQIGEYEARGFHRTGANVDRLSGEWLADEVTKAGATAGARVVSTVAVDPTTTALIWGSRGLEGLITVVSFTAHPVYSDYRPRHHRVDRANSQRLSRSVSNSR